MDAPPVHYVTTSDGYDIAYMTSGEGRPLVLMPGPVTRIDVFWRSQAMRPLLEELASRFHLIQYDARGQGMSMRGLHDDLTMEDWELDIEAVVARERLGNFVLASFSSNAYVAATYALRHAERVDALIVWNMPLVRQTVVPSSLDELALENWDFFIDASARTTFPWEDPAVAQQIWRDTWTQADWFTRARAWKGIAIEGLLGKLELPTLVLATRTGAWRFATEEDSRRIAALIPDSRLVVFEEPGGGFFGYGARTPPAVPVIEDFLKDVTEGTGQRMQPSASGQPPGLSLRELEVLRLVAAGQTNQQIADVLVISRNTVRRHVSNVFDKTGIVNRAQAGAWAREHGLV